MAEWIRRLLRLFGLDEGYRTPPSGPGPGVERVGCCLGKVKEFGPQPWSGSLQFDGIEELGEGSGFEIAVCRCAHCGGLYIRCLAEARAGMADEGDNWVFWIPASDEEINRVRRAPGRESLLTLIKYRPYIVWHPSGRAYWAEGLGDAEVLCAS